MDMHKILVVEDDQFFIALIQQSLGSQFELKFASSIHESIVKIQGESFDLFIVDILLPGGSGLDICSYIRSQETTKIKPVIVLSSKNEIQDKVMGLDFGADDYLIKPCHPQELIARTKAHLRRGHNPNSKEAIHIADYKIDLIKQRAYEPSGKSIDLTNIEFKLLVYFARHLDHILSRRQILEAVWPDNLNVTERVIDTHISNLRKKLGVLGAHLKAVHGAGYSFTILAAA
jgi:two-component system phosphate regulon response regulator PhoB